MRIILIMAVLSGCTKPLVTTDAGCASYGEARLGLPKETATLSDEWLRYIAETDTRMTAVCR